MRCRSSLLVIGFLAVPLAAQPTAPIRPGEVSLEISDAKFAALAVSVPALGAGLCKGASAFPEKVRIRCHPDGDTAYQQQVLTLRIVEARSERDGTTLVHLFPRNLTLAGRQPFNTSCGSWRYSLTLDPRATQKISQAVLRPEAGDTLAGEVHGVLSVAAVLHLEPVGDGPRIDRPMTLSLDLKGRWAALPLPLAGAVLDERKSNLVLFAEPPGKPGASWKGRSGCSELSPFVGEVCLSASRSLLKSLNVNP